MIEVAVVYAAAILLLEFIKGYQIVLVSRDFHWLLLKEHLDHVLAQSRWPSGARRGEFIGASRRTLVQYHGDVGAEVVNFARVELPVGAFSIVRGQRSHIVFVESQQSQQRCDAWGVANGKDSLCIVTEIGATKMRLDGNRQSNREEQKQRHRSGRYLK